MCPPQKIRYFGFIFSHKTYKEILGTQEQIPIGSLLLCHNSGDISGTLLAQKGASNEPYEANFRGPAIVKRGKTIFSLS